MPLDYQAVRALTLDVLREVFRQGETQQLVDIVNRVEAAAISRGLIPRTQQLSVGVTVQVRMSEEDRETARQVLWDLVLEGVLFPGSSADQPDVHFLKRTIFGKAVLLSASPTPYDPDGYLAALKQEVPGLDQTVITYITEALQTFLRGNLLASTVMLGVASEKLILILIETYINAIQNQTRKGTVQRGFDSRNSISRKFQFLRGELNAMAATLRAQVADDLDIQLDGVFNLLRNTRNEAGHPTGVTIDRRRAYASLTVFTSYCRTVYGLITYFTQNPIA